MLNINLQGGQLEIYRPRAEGPRAIYFQIGRLAGLYFAYRPMNHTISDITYHEIHMLLGVGHFEFSEHAHSVPQHMLECKMAAGWY